MHPIAHKSIGCGRDPELEPESPPRRPGDSPRYPLADSVAACGSGLGEPDVGIGTPWGWGSVAACASASGEPDVKTGTCVGRTSAAEAAKAEAAGDPPRGVAGDRMASVSASASAAAGSSGTCHWGAQSVNGGRRRRTKKVTAQSRWRIWADFRRMSQASARPVANTTVARITNPDITAGSSTHGNEFIVLPPRPCRSSP